MKKIILNIALLMIALMIVIAGCSKADSIASDSGASAGSDAAGTAQQGTQEAKGPAKVGNVPKETLGSLANINCGDGICNNREYLSSTKMYECRSLLDSCSIDADGKKIGTENYFICRKDCTGQCDLDFDMSICSQGDSVYKISVVDRKGNFYSYALLYRAERVPFVKYGGSKGDWTLDLSSVASVIGGMESIEIVPRVMNSDGTLGECTNHIKTFTSVESC